MAKSPAQGASVQTIAGRSTLTPQKRQHMVRDEVVFAPARSPYAALERASQRLSQGKEVLASTGAIPKKK